MEILSEFIKKHFYRYQIERIQFRDDNNINNDYNNNEFN